MSTYLTPPVLDTGAPASSRLEQLSAWAERQRRWALAFILLVAAFCNFYELARNGFANLYYAAAIRSMLESWHNFFFVSFDPGGFVTVDKPPLGFWIQAASAKIFGFSGISILAPEALAGVLSVGVLYLIVRRVFGTAAGLFAALFLAITPISVVTNRNNTIDSLLVLTVLLGAYAVTRAAGSGSLRWLLLCALLVGLGFNIKMLEAYLVVPAFAAVYLFGAPVRWRTRLWHLALAGVVLVVISMSWVVAVDLTPATARPYVGSSGTNSELELALGYNGLERLTGLIFHTTSPAASATGGTSAAPSASGGGAAGGSPGGVSENGTPGVFRLLNAELGGQVSWLLALGLFGMLASGWAIGLGRMRLGARRGVTEAASLGSTTAPGERGPGHLNARQSALLLWGGWTLTQAAFFSVAGFFHTYYLSMLAPGIAALAGIGLVLLWHDYRLPSQLIGWRGWLLPCALVATGLTQAIIVADYAGWNTWITPLVVGGSLLAAAVLVLFRVGADHAGETSMLNSVALPSLGVSPKARMLVPILATTLAVAVLLVGPVAWVGVSLASGATGNLPKAGPTATTALLGGNTGGGPAGGFPGGEPPAGPRGFGGPPPLAGGFPEGAFGPPNGAGGSANGPNGASGGPGGGAGASDQLSQVDSQLVAYLEQNRGSARYLFATTSSMTAAPYIIVTGQPVMALGGFNGSDTILTLSQLQALIREGQVRYFLLDGAGGGPGGGAGNAQLTQWVTATCVTISASTYGGSAASGGSDGTSPGQGGPGGGQLYDCASAAGATATS